MQQAITPPKADLLSPAVAQLVGEVLSTVSRDDTNPIGDYIEMCRTSPIVGALLDVIRLYAHGMMGEYDNENEDYKTFIIKCFEVMQGSLKMAVDQLMCVKPLGYAVSEWAPIERDGKWVLDAIRILDPRKYEFEGTRNGIEFVVYDGDAGNIKIPYDRCIHLTNQQHLSFDDPYGVADCRRVIAPYKAWKIAIAAALIAAKRRGEPVIVGFAPSDQQVQIGTDRATGEPIRVPAPQALMGTLQGLENNSIAATDIANKIETIQAADGQLIMLVLKELERLQLMGFLVPDTILSATGVGDSSLNSGHRSILDLMVGATIDQIKEKLIEQVVRPLLIWEFGEAVEDFGSFPTPKASETGAIDLLNAIANAVYNGAFSAADLDVINRMRELAGLPLVTEVVDPLAGAPIDAATDPIEPTADPVDAAADTGIDDAAANFAAARGGRGGKGRKKGKGQKNCNKGINCGGTCISAKKACRKDNPSPAVKTKAKRGKASKSGGGGGETPEKTPDWKSVLSKDEIKQFDEMLDLGSPNTDFAGAQEFVRSGTAKLKAGTGSNKAIDDDLVIGRDGLTGFGAADLNAALDSIPKASERISQLRQFVNDQKIKVVFNDRRLEGRGSEETAKLAKAIGADPYYVAAQNNALGYTARHISHVQVVPSKDLKYDKAAYDRGIKEVNRNANKPVDRKPFSGDGYSSGSLYTYLHEVGHQVDFKSEIVDRRSGRKVDPAKLTPTGYGATNKQEAFAESFALYMIHGDKFAKSHPEAAAWVKERLDWVTTK
jgi:hypothetical protein